MFYKLEYVLYAQILICKVTTMLLSNKLSNNLTAVKSRVKHKAYLKCVQCLCKCAKRYIHSWILWPVGGPV